MQIQRIQTLWLIAAVACSVFSLTCNWLNIDNQLFISAYNNIPLLILGALAVLLPMIAIFLYRNLRRQKLTVKIAMLFVVATLGYAVALSYLGPHSDAAVCILGPTCMAVSGIFDWLALRGIVHDDKLLRSADRLR